MKKQWETEEKEREKRKGTWVYEDDPVNMIRFRLSARTILWTACTWKLCTMRSIAWETYKPLLDPWEFVLDYLGSEARWSSSGWTALLKQRLIWSTVHIVFSCLRAGSACANCEGKGVHSWSLRFLVCFIPPSPDYDHATGTASEDRRRSQGRRSGRIERCDGIIEFDKEKKTSKQLYLVLMEQINW